MATPLARRIVIAAALVGLLARLAFALGYWVGKPLTHDEHEYLHLAENLASGQGLRYDPPAGETPAMQFGRAPLYPAFLAAVRVAGGGDAVVRNVQIVQAALGAVTVLLVAAIAWRAAGPTAGAIAATIAALYPPLVWIPAYILSETLYSVLALAAVLILAPVLDGAAAAAQREGRASVRVGLAGGLVAGAAVLTRPAMLFFLMLAGVWLLRQRRRALALALAAGSLAVVTPWTIRNYQEYGRLILVASEGGITFWTGNHRLSPGEGDMAANPAIKLDNRRFRAANPGLTEEELEPLYYREAIRTIAADPAWWVGLLARKLLYTFVPAGPSYTLHSRRYLAATWVSYGVLLPLGAWGLVLAWRRGRRPTTLLLLAASAVLVCVVFFPQERFRIPVLDPTLIIGAGALFALRRHAGRAPLERQ